MNYPPPTHAAPASAVRRRRSRRGAPLKHSAPRRRPGVRRGKSEKGLRWWHWLVLAALLILVALSAVSLARADGSMRQLELDREKAREQYERTVRNHQVRYRDLIERYAAEYSLDPAFVSAIIFNESSYDPEAVSSKGAMGLMQFMPSTFDWVAPNCGISKNDLDAVKEPENAIKMGCYLLKYICGKLGSDDPVLVACAYHAGWGHIPGWIEKYSTDGKTLAVSQIPTGDTRTYAGRVLNSYAIYLQHYY